MAMVRRTKIKSLNRKRHQYSIEYKLNAVAKWRELNENTSQAARHPEVNVDRQTLKGWILNEESYRCMSNKKVAKRLRKRTKNNTPSSMKYGDIEKKLVQFIRPDLLDKKEGTAMIRTLSIENKVLVKELDKNVKNKFRFEWLEKTVTVRIKVGKKIQAVVEKIGNFIVKCDIPGKAKCTYCDDVISYGSRGYLSLVEHAARAKKHAEKVRLRHLKNSLGSALTKSNTVDQQSRPKYVTNGQTISNSAPLTPLNDRKAHSEPNPPCRGASNQSYLGKEAMTRRTRNATATLTSVDSLSQPSNAKFLKKAGMQFENRQQKAMTHPLRTLLTPRVQMQLQQQQHLQGVSMPPATAQPATAQPATVQPATRKVRVLAPPVHVRVAQPKPVQKPWPREKQIFVVADHQRCIMSNLASLWKSGKLCDAGIGNGLATVMVHKLVLYAVCPKLLSVFNTDTHSNEFLQVNFPRAISTEALNAFAEYMYNGVLDLDHDILEQLKIIAKRLKMKEFEQLCDSHLPNHMHQPAAAAVASFTNVPLIQTSMQFPSMTSSLPSLSSTISAPVQSAPSITTQVIDVKQEISESELAQVKKETIDVFSQESEMESLAPNKSGNTAGFVICPSIKTEPVGPEDDKYGHLSSNDNNQTFTSTVPSSSSSSLAAASTSITSVPASQTEFAIPFSETTDVKSTKLKASHSYESPLVSDLSPVSCIVETVCSQSSHMTEDSSKSLSQSSNSLPSVDLLMTTTSNETVYPVRLFTSRGDNLPLLPPSHLSDTMTLDTFTADEVT